MRLALSIFFLATVISHHHAVAQNDTIVPLKKPGYRKAIMKDTLDRKFAFSRFLIDAKGFVPVPFIITEPALWGFGLAVAPMFLTPKKRPVGYKGYIPPDIIGRFCMYTTNNCWILGGLRAEANLPFCDPPFYALPSLFFRGVPAVRFQGYTTALIESEQRWDINLR